MSIGRDTVCSGHRTNRPACAFAAGRTSSSRKPTCWHLLVRLGRSAVMRLAYRHGLPSVFAPGAVARFVGIDQNAGSLDQNTADGGLHAAIPKIREGHRAEIGRNARRRGSLQGCQDAKRRKAAGAGGVLLCCPGVGSAGSYGPHRRAAGLRSPEIQGIALEILRFHSMAAAGGAPKGEMARSAAWSTEGAARRRKLS